MKIEELENAPRWLLDADTEGADVVIMDGEVHWCDGIWKDGIWEGGVWHGGTWERGTWNSGTWYGGYWHGGEWLGGTWEDGVWRGGRLVKVLNADLPPVS